MATNRMEARAVMLHPDPLAAREMADALGTRFEGVDVVATWQAALAALRDRGAAALVVDCDADGREAARLGDALDALGPAGAVPSVALVAADAPGPVPSGLEGAALLVQPVRPRLLVDLAVRLVEARLVVPLHAPHLGFYARA